MGARGLRALMEGILLDTMFELPSLEGVKEVVISREVVDGTARPLYIDHHSRQRVVGRVTTRKSQTKEIAHGPSEIRSLMHQGRNGSGLPLPAPAKQAHCGEPGGEERQRRWQWRGGGAIAYIIANSR